MGTIIVDQTKCRKDGLCVKECPLVIIHLQDKESFPEVIPGGEAVCLQCGHCVAVCPHGALSHRQVPLAECPAIDQKLRVTEEQAVQFLRSRRSVRFFEDRPVEKEIIQQLIETARYAPTAGNSQALEWIVVTREEKIRELAGLTVDWMRSILRHDPQPASAPYMPLIVAAWDAGIDVVLRKAPALIVASAPGADANGLVNVSLALSYLELAAVPLGLGTCWAGLLQGGLLASPGIQESLGLPQGHTHHYPMMLGYAKPKYFRLPQRRPPKITWNESLE
jgi:nitroreductase/NAD-dependent dihydropyrimidine dehydrogenase PreA subunit